MARRYYILRDGERLYRETREAITHLARKLANATGRQVQVHYEELDPLGRPGRSGKSHRKAPSKGESYSRNPAEVHHSYRYLTPAAAKRAAASIRKRLGRSKPVAILPEANRPDRYGVFYKNPDPSIVVDHAWRMHQARQAQAEARRKPTARSGKHPYIVKATAPNGKLAYAIKRPNLAAARAVAAELRAAGYAVTIAANNPATRSRKPKGGRPRTGNRTHWVEFKYGGALERKRFANKGLATVAANELKRSGATRVRVYSA